jgi:2-oxoisovalerate dehydrogenase E2 component (dihydrolipoyl transacylase)
MKYLPSLMQTYPIITFHHENYRPHLLSYLPILYKTHFKAMYRCPLFRSSITLESISSGNRSALTVRPHSDISIALSTPRGYMRRQFVPWTRTLCTASALQHLAYPGRQGPSTLTPAELPRRGRTLTVSNVGAAGAGESPMPVLAPRGGVGIDAL